MSSSPELLQTAIEAVKQRRYSEGIQLLKTFCRSDTNPSTKDYFQAQLWLVKAYQENGQSEQAIALCQQLAASGNSQVQAQAQRILQSLSASRAVNSQASESSLPLHAQSTQAFSEEQPRTEQPAAQPVPNKQTLTPEQAEARLKIGSKALKQGHYAEAVQALEEFCNGTDASDKDYSQAQMWLTKAYKANGQLEEAIALCQQLTTSEHQIAQIWAQQFLQSLSPNQAIETPSSQSQPIPQARQAANVSPSRSRSSAASPDLTRPILSVLCHGSIIFASGLLPILIPLVIWIVSKDKIVQDNAKEALSFVINIIVWGIAFAILMVIKIGWALLILLWIFSLIMPIIAIIQCVQKPDKPVRYPFISHLF